MCDFRTKSTLEWLILRATYLGNQRKSAVLTSTGSRFMISLAKSRGKISNRQTNTSRVLFKSELSKMKQNEPLMRVR